MKEWLIGTGRTNITLNIPGGLNSSVLSNCYGRTCFRPLNATEIKANCECIALLLPILTTCSAPRMNITHTIIPFAQRNETKPAAQSTTCLPDRASQLILDCKHSVEAKSASKMVMMVQSMQKGLTGTKADV